MDIRKRTTSSGAAGVTGPLGSTDNALVRFDGLTGAVIQNSVAILSDTGDLVDLQSLQVTADTYTTGTGTITNASTGAVVGVGTAFLTELEVGDKIKIGAVIQNVTAIADDTHLTVNYPGTYAGQAFDIIHQNIENLDSAASVNIKAYPDGSLTVRTLQVNEPLSSISIGPTFGSGPQLNFGFGDETVNHRFRSIGGGNDSVALDIVSPTTHYFYVNGQFQNSKGMQIGYAAGTTPPLGGANISAYTKIGGLAVSTAPSVGGDAFSFEIGSANLASIGTTYAVSNNSFSNPFSAFTALGIPARVFSLTIESGTPGAGGEAKKVFTSENTAALDYDCYIGTAGVVSRGVRFTVRKSNGAGGNAALDASDTAYSFDGNGGILINVLGTGATTFSGYVSTINGSDSAPSFKFARGDGFYSVAQSVIGVNCGGSNKDAARFEFSSSKSTWYFNTELSLQSITGSEFFRCNTTGTTMSFFGATAVAKQTSGANLTNNVTSGGTDNTIADYSDLATYANDAAEIRNNIYQLARKLKQINDGLRSYGLFT